jgi:RimJ/RimL family protein N-acetyltransferase
MELLRTERLLLRHWDESDLAAFFDLYSRHLHPQHQGQGLATEAARALLTLAGTAGIDQVLAITDSDNAASQRVAMRLGMTDEGLTERWFGLTARQYRKVIGPLES